MNEIIYNIINSTAQLKHIYGIEGIGKTTNIIQRIIQYYCERNKYK